MKIGAVDLFCGAGGLTHGLNAENIPVMAGIDIDENCRYPFETNNGGTFLKSDVNSLSNSELDELFGGAEIRVLRFRRIPSVMRPLAPSNGVCSTNSAS